MSDKCEKRGCKTKKTDDLYKRNAYGGVKEESPWLCLNCFEAEFGKFGRLQSEDKSNTKEESLQVEDLIQTELPDEDLSEVA